MARSPLTLAAAATAAVPGVEIVEVTALTAGGGDRNDAAVATLSDGSRIVIRVPQDDAVDADLATEALALRALTEGVRSLLAFTVPEFLGAAPIGRGRLFVTTFIPGYLVDAPHIPSGRGVAESLGRSLAAVHALPTTIVRGAGLPVRSAVDVRADARRVMDQSAATGRVPVRLMVRWREVIDDDAMWQFEPTVTLGGAGADAFVFEDEAGEPHVNGIIDWHGLQVTDPAVDLQFLPNAPEAADTIFEAYAAAGHRAPDEMLRTRARLHSELEFARWLLHGRDTHRDDIMDDAAGMLDALAEDVRHNDLAPRTASTDVDDALAALESTPHPTTSADTSMQTDAYDPEELGFFDDEAEHRRLAASLDTQAYSPADLAADPQSDSGPDTQRIEPLMMSELDPHATQPIDAATLAAETGGQPADERPGVDRIDPDFLAGLQTLHDTGDLSAIAGVSSGMSDETDEDSFAPGQTQPIDPTLFADGDERPDGGRRTWMHDD